MADISELRMNVAALKRVDPYVKDILETATHVALYTFNADNNEWEKTDIEGALFVYSRNGEPYNSVLIMNRLNTNNLVEPVTQGLDLQLQEPFLLYRNSKCNIYGIWFYDKEECVRIATMLTKLVKASEENRKVCNKPVIKGKKNAGQNTNNVDIFSMLSKAQEDFNTNKGSGDLNNSGSGGGNSSKSPSSVNVADNVTGSLSAPLGPDVTSQSVMDFFAKAKVNTGHFKAGDQPTVSNTVPNEGKPLLARLMSHPAAHMLENIEKQHRSITPTGHQSQSTPVAMTANNISTTSSVKSKKRIKPMMDMMDPKDLSINQSSNNETNGSSGFLRIQSPSTGALSNISTNQPNTSGRNFPPNLASLFGQSSSTMTSEELIEPTLTSTTTTVAPALIPPVMFAASSPPEPISRPLEPLTRNQLLQAFEYLLKSDPEFITKLHEAYVKSFSEILS